MITSILLLLGTLLVFIANRGEVNAWEPLDIFLTLGLVGYLLIISAIARFLLTFLNKRLDDIV